VGTGGAAHTHGEARVGFSCRVCLAVPLFSFRPSFVAFFVPFSVFLHSLHIFCPLHLFVLVVTVGPVCCVIHSASAGILEGEGTKVLVRPICSLQQIDLQAATRDVTVCLPKTNFNIILSHTPQYSTVEFPYISSACMSCFCNCTVSV
jgi:hypothetical protein